MADHIHGPLYYERMGRSGPVIAFIHPNPMDQSCWMFQMAHLSTWYRCVAIDIPGYGRSPKADAGLTMTDMAQACWEAIDDAAAGESATLVGCSVGSSIAPYMYHERPKQDSRIDSCGHGLQSHQRVHQGADRKLFEARRRLSMGVYFRGLQRRVSHNPPGAFLRQPVHRSQPTRRRRDDHSSVQSTVGAVPRGPPRKYSLSDDHSHRQRGQLSSARLRFAEARTQLRVEDFTRSGPRLPDRAAVAVQSLHDRISCQAWSVPRKFQDRALALARQLCGGR